MGLCWCLSLCLVTRTGCWRCTCLLAVQNFFWKNSSFIWIPTAERGETQQQEGFVCKSVTHDRRDTLHAREHTHNGSRGDTLKQRIICASVVKRSCLNAQLTGITNPQSCVKCTCQFTDMRCSVCEHVCVPVCVYVYA